MSVKVVYHGHSCVEVHHDAYRLQFDPFYDQNGVADCKSQDVNPTHILLSHAHFDHTDDVERIAKRTGAVIAANYEIATHYDRKGLKTEAMNHGGSVRFPWGKATMTIAFHTSSFPDGSYGGEPAGWIVEIGGKTIYFAGDTALFGDMKVIGELWSLDLACLPIGDRYTMGPKHALIAAQWLKARSVLPIHYDTWPPIAQDAAAFATELKARGISALPLRPGESAQI